MQFNHLGGGFLHRFEASNGINEFSVADMGISPGHGERRVPQQLSNDIEPGAASPDLSREVVPQVVKMEIFYTCSLRRLGEIAGHVTDRIWLTQTQG